MNHEDKRTNNSSFDQLYSNNRAYKHLYGAYGIQTTIEEDCFLCAQKFSPIFNSKTLDCSHKFHKKCVDHWLKKQRTCPLCRLPVPPTNE